MSTSVKSKAAWATVPTQAVTAGGVTFNAHVLRNDPGLVTDGHRMKLYVMNWYTLLDGFELTHGFMLDKLKLKRDDYSAATREELVADLQAAR